MISRRHGGEAPHRTHPPVSRRDKSLHEDATRTSDPSLAQNMATLNYLIIGLVLQHGWRYLPTARRHYSGCLENALQLIFGPPG